MADTKRKVSMADVDVRLKIVSDPQENFPDQSILRFETSAKTGEGVKEAFESITRKIIEFKKR